MYDPQIRGEGFSSLSTPPPFEQHQAVDTHNGSPNVKHPVEQLGVKPAIFQSQSHPQ
jgi:hypothetical protein